MILRMSGGKDFFLYYTTRQGQEKLMISNGKKYRLAINNIDFILGSRVVVYV